MAGFVFRVRLGEYELELSGSREEVLKTVQEDLPALIANVHSAFNSVKPKTVATLTVKAEQPKEEAGVVRKFPKIAATDKCDEAVLRVLESDWGKWRPRTMDELREALKSNAMSFGGRVLAGVLLGLVRKGRVRRWKTDAGYVYILAEKE
ncbi:hypothetical protein HXY32_07435 [Candidatus Bathyarchaeota archaeon]|nr:hypothetical protein [Candidatus Bathyarchaeota archaeon]